MDSKDHLDLRNKRLNYYNKIISNNVITNKIVDKRDEKSNAENNSLYHSTSLQEFQNDSNQSSTLDILDKNSMLILNKLFGENTKRTLPTHNRKISLDEYSLDQSSDSFVANGFNQKLEEFKRVVENSYNQHVLNKSESLFNQKQPSRQSSINIDEQNKNIFNSSNHNNNNNNNESSLVSFLNEPSQILNETLTSPKPANGPCQIPYMSAYNIYNENSDAKSMVSLSSTSHIANVAEPLAQNNKINHFESFNNTLKLESNEEKNFSNENDLIMKKYFDSLKKEDKPKKSIDFNIQKKKVSSTGSSLTSSPTSTSSMESGKKFTEESKENDFLLNAQYKSSLKLDTDKINISSVVSTPREAKPPETPKTAKSVGSTYRRNLMLKLNQSKSSNPNQPNNSENKTEDILNKFDFNLLENYSAIIKRNNSVDETKVVPPIKNISRASLDFGQASNRSLKSSNSLYNSFNLNNKKKLDPIEVKASTKMASSSNDLFKDSLKSPLPSGKANKLEKIFFNNNNNTKKNVPFKNKDVTNKNNKNLNNFNSINGKKVNNKNKNKNKNKNVFNFVEEDSLGYYDDKDLYNNKSSEEDDKDGQDTFDIFSSQDSISDLDRTEQNSLSKNIDKVEMVRFTAPEATMTKKFDLKIDLGQLSNNEDDPPIKPNIFLKNDDTEDEESLDNENKDKVNEIASMNSTSRQQYPKPDNIPNLMLDLIDDDKSQSVAASLAKSMCKEIDYKQEMEMIYKNEPEFETKIGHNQKTTNSNKEVRLNRTKMNSSSIINPTIHHFTSNHSNNFNINTTNSNFNFNSGHVAKTASNKQLSNNLLPNENENAKDNVSQFMKPPVSSRLTTPRQLKSKINPFSSTKDIRCKTTDSNRCDVASDNESNSTYAFKDGRKSIVESNAKNQNLHPKRFGSRSPSPSLLRELNAEKNIKASKNSKKLHWQTSSTNGSLNKRPNTAAQKTSAAIINEDDQIVKQNFLNEIPKSPLFFNYAKLVAIESNLQKEIMKESEYNRPKTANHISITNTIPFEENYANNILTSMNLVDSLSIGNQEAYKNLMLDNRNKLEPITFTNSENKPSSTIDWLTLPHELWLKIMSFLKHKDLIQFGRSCKLFSSIYLDNTLWREISMKYKYNMRDEWLEWIGKRKPNELNIIQCAGNITLHGISEMFRNIGDELNSLNLSRCSNGSLSGDNFALQASIRCPNITKLDLSWTLLSNQTLKLIVDSFKKIESINLSGCNMIQEDGLNTLLVKHGENLKNLEISGCIHFSSNCVINIGAYCRELENLNISNCHRMTNESIIEACPQWIKLKFIDLRGIKNIKNNCISVLVRRCPLLEGLALGECVHIGDASLLEIATYKPNIKYLDINGCKKITDTSLRSLANFCVKLEYLNLKGTNVTDNGLITLSNGRCTKTLEEIILSYLPISEFVLLKFLKNFIKLKKISLYGCYNLKHVDEVKEAVEPKHENLKNLIINV